MTKLIQIINCHSHGKELEELSEYTSATNVSSSITNASDAQLWRVKAFAKIID